MAIQSKMVSADLQQFVLGSPLLLSASAFLVVLSFIRFLMNRPKRLDLPIVGEPDDADHLKAMIEGTAKVRLTCNSNLNLTVS
jgi:hypothetical protein